jgi:hypothetical protein
MSMPEPVLVVVLARRHPATAKRTKVQQVIRLAAIDGRRSRSRLSKLPTTADAITMLAAPCRPLSSGLRPRC